VLGLQEALGSLPGVVQLSLVLGVLVPITYTLSSLAMALLRRTPLSLVLSGRRMSSPVLAAPDPCSTRPIPAL
jgi:hypothetical protein